jgi:hypothetical protein
MIRASDEVRKEKLKYTLYKKTCLFFSQTREEKKRKKKTSDAKMLCLLQETKRRKIRNISNTDPKSPRQASYL